MTQIQPAKWPHKPYVLLLQSTEECGCDYGPNGPIIPNVKHLGFSPKFSCLMKLISKFGSKWPIWNINWASFAKKKQTNMGIVQLPQDGLNRSWSYMFRIFKFRIFKLRIFKLRTKILWTRDITKILAKDGPDSPCLENRIWKWHDLTRFDPKFCIHIIMGLLGHLSARIPKKID